MRTIKLFILLVLLNTVGVAFAVTLPPDPFFGANELYEEGQDEIEYEVGTRVRGINYILTINNETWGNTCWNESFGESGKCQTCCDASWAARGYLDEDEVLYNTCLDICKGGPSLPLGSALWLLPFAFAYGFYKRYKNKKADC